VIAVGVKCLACDGSLRQLHIDNISDTFTPIPNKAGPWNSARSSVPKPLGSEAIRG